LILLEASHVFPFPLLPPSQQLLPCAPSACPHSHSSPLQTPACTTASTSEKRVYLSPSNLKLLPHGILSRLSQPCCWRVSRKQHAAHPSRPTPAGNFVSCDNAQYQSSKRRIAWRHAAPPKQLLGAQPRRRQRPRLNLHRLHNVRRRFVGGSVTAGSDFKICRPPLICNAAASECSSCCGHRSARPCLRVLVTQQQRRQCQPNTRLQRQHRFHSHNVRRTPQSCVVCDDVA
jgi:hypothetical protein